MNQITITVDMTPENLEILKQLCPMEAPAAKPAKKTTKKAEEQLTPVGTEPYGEFTTQDVKEDKPTVSLTDVRAVALKLSKAGKQDVLKAAFAKFGGKKLSDIKPDDYPALMEALAAEVTDNA